MTTTAIASLDTPPCIIESWQAREDILRDLRALTTTCVYCPARPTRPSPTTWEPNDLDFLCGSAGCREFWLLRLDLTARSKRVRELLRQLADRDIELGRWREHVWSRLHPLEARLGLPVGTIIEDPPKTLGQLFAWLEDRGEIWRVSYRGL